MPGFLILMFAAVFGVTLVAVGLGWHFVEQQRRKRVTTMLTTVSSIEGVVQEWEVASGHRRVLLRVPTGVTAAALSPDARFLVTGSGDGIVQVWDLAFNVAR